MPLETEQTNADLQTLLAATHYLMTRYALQCNNSHAARYATNSADAVCQHLEMILQHPDIRHSSVSRSSYEGLLFEWRAILSHNQQHGLARHLNSTNKVTDNTTNKNSLH